MIHIILVISLMVLYDMEDYLIVTHPTSTPIEWAMNPRTEKIANPETIEAPELKPERIMHHLYELNENLLYEPFYHFEIVLLL